MKKIPKKIKKILLEIKEEYKSKNSTISILLFGSFAKGTFDKNSDLDLEIITSDKKYKTFVQKRKGIKIDIEMWPKEKLIKDFKKNPFLKYPYLSEKILYDPTGFAKNFKKEVRDYFKKHPKTRKMWVNWEKDYIKLKKEGKKIPDVSFFYTKLKKALK